MNKTFFILITLISGCSTWVVRSNYHLDHYQELVVSDSPTQLLQPKKIKSGTIEIKQSILIQNTSTKNSYTIHQDNAHFNVNGQTLNPKCVDTQEKAGAMTLVAGAKNRMDCTLVIEANANNKLISKDTTGILEIPVAEVGKSMEFHYALKVEDFE